MTIIKDGGSWQESVVVKSVLRHLKKREEHRQRFLWAITISLLITFVVILLLFIRVVY